MQASTQAVTQAATQPPIPITVLQITPVARGGNLKAYAKVQVGCFVIYRCRIVHDQKSYVQLPLFEDVNSRFWSALDVTDPLLLEAIKAAILAAWKAFQAEAATC